MTEKQLLIRGPLRHEDLRDVLKIAVVEGRKILRTNDVYVKPVVELVGTHDYRVCVCDGVSSVGDRKNFRAV